MSIQDSETYAHPTRRIGLGVALGITTLSVLLAYAVTVVLNVLIIPLYSIPGPWQYILAGLPELPVAISAVLASWIAFILAGRHDIALPKVPIAVLIGSAVLLPLAMRVLVFDNYILEVDEYMLSVQADIFVDGAMAAQMPPGLEHIARAAHPYMANHDAESGVWSVFYLPVFALLLAMGDILVSEAVVNPILAAVSVYMVWSIARNLWPDDNYAAPIAALLLFSSPQFLFPASTGFALTAHLAFNLIWLRLILSANKKHLVLAAVVGFLAVGLHRPHIHLLFAFPFVAAWMFGWQRRGVVTAFAFGAVYSVALYVWVGWADWSIALATGDWSAFPLNPLEFKALERYADLSEFSHGRFEEAYRYWIMGHNLLRLSAWLNPAVLCLFVLGFILWRHLSWTERLIIFSALSSILPYTYLMSNPSIGWGYRFSIPALGVIVLGGVAAWHALKMQHGQQKRATGFLVVTTAFALVVLFPLHGWRTATDVRAHAAAQKGLESIDADIVLLDHFSFRTYHAHNRADLTNRPLFLVLPYLLEEARHDLCAGTFDIVTASAGAFEELGIEDRSRRFHGLRVSQAETIADLRDRGCVIDDSALRKPD